jgi:hypothetical protein
MLALTLTQNNLREKDILGKGMILLEWIMGV